MKKVNSHVGIPKFLISRFTINNKVYWKRMDSAIYYSYPQKVGVFHNYYTIEIEKLLSQFVEARFNDLLKRIDSYIFYYEKLNILYQEKATLIEYIRFQFNRSLKVLKFVRKYSRYANSITPSEFMEFTKLQKASLLNMIKGKIMVRILTSEYGLITNSLGFYYFASSKKPCFLIPISTNEGILFEEAKEDEEFTHYIASESDSIELNKRCVVCEKVIGNGFILASKKELLNDINY